MARWVSLLCLGALFVGAARSEDSESVKGLLSKVTKAYGGEDTLKKVKAITIKTRTKTDAGVVSVNELTIQLPGMVRRVLTEKGGPGTQTVIEVLHGHKGSIKQNGTVAPLPRAEVKLLHGMVSRILMTTYPPVLEHKSYTLSVLPETTVGEHKAVGIKVGKKGHHAYKMYYDVKTGYLLKSERRFKHEKVGKMIDQVAEYSDVKDVGHGLMRPTKIKILHDGKKVRDIEVLSYVLHEKALPEAKFDHP